MQNENCKDLWQWNARDQRGGLENVRPETAEPKLQEWENDAAHTYKNSSGDEIANVNFLRRYGTYVLKNTIKENLLRLTN